MLLVANGRSGCSAGSSVVIIGGGAAGFACAEMLRRRGYGGAITMLSADKDYPVDRPNLSKYFLAGEAEAAWMPLRSKSFYPKNNIDLKLNAVVDEIDLDGRKVVLKDGASYDFDRLLIATGANPVKLPIAGADQDHVFTLRSYQDSRDIVAAAEHAKSAVILGSGFIGLEVAASLRQRDLEGHVVSMDQLPLEKVMGRYVGVFIKQLHESHEVKFHMQTTIDKIDANTVTLKDGSELPAELVIIGVGVKPDTGLAEAAGLKVDKGILVNAELESEIPGVFAAGDVARWNDGKQTHRVEHWVVAERQGQIVAENMLGAQQKYVDAPFFWSAHYDVTIRYAGDGMGWDDASIEGDLLKHDALVRYTKDGKLIAVAGIGRDAKVAKIATELRTL